MYSVVSKKNAIEQSNEGTSLGIRHQMVIERRLISGLHRLADHQETVPSSVFATQLITTQT